MNRGAERKRSPRLVKGKASRIAVLACILHSVGTCETRRGGHKGPAAGIEQLECSPIGIIFSSLFSWSSHKK